MRAAVPGTSFGILANELLNPQPFFKLTGRKERFFGFYIGWTFIGFVLFRKEK